MRLFDSDSRELLDMIGEVTKPLKQLANVISDDKESEYYLYNKEVFNRDIGGVSSSIIGSVFFAETKYGEHENILPFIYGSCYSALKIADGLARLRLDGNEDAFVLANQSQEACANLIKVFEGEAGYIYEKNKEEKRESQERFNRIMGKSA